MKTLKKLMSVILTAAMLLSLAPAVMAQSAPSFRISAPTPERIFAVVNDYSLDYGMIMSEYGWMPYTDLDTDEHVNIYDSLNEDGTFNEETKALFVELADTSEADGSLDADSAQLLRDAETLTDILRVVAVFTHLSMINTYPAMIEEAEAEGNEELVMILREAQAVYEENYPDHEAVYLKMVNDCFGGNTEPSVAEIVSFVSWEDVLIDDEGFVYYYDSDFAETPEDTFGVSDIITPTGAFTASYEMYGGHRNVYEQLKAEWEAGNIDNEEAFAILFGYVPDAKGDLCHAVPLYNTLYDENGKRVRNVLDVINDDGTVLDSGLSVRDFAVAEALKMYEDDSIQDIIGDDLIEDSYMGFILNFYLENIPLEEIMGDIITGEGDMSTEESVAAEIDGFIESMAPYVEYEGELEEALLMIYCGVEYDLYGYVAMGSTQDYLRDADGNKVKLSDVMAEDGTLLNPEMGESVQALMEELLANMSYDALLLGDVNVDGKVNLSDISAMLKKIAAWDVELSDVASDTNGDGNTNLSDVSLALQYIAGWDVYFAY